MNFFFSVFTICIFSGQHKSAITGHSIWSHDAHVIMQDVSHLKLITTSLLQTCGYITGQMKAPVSIDVNKFMEAFSINMDGQEVHPPSWRVGEDNSVTLSPTTPVLPSTPLRPFTMEDYILCRRAEAIRWIDHQEKQSSIIPRLQPVTPEEYQERRDAVNSESGPLRRKGMKIYMFWQVSYPLHNYLAKKGIPSTPKNKPDTNTNSSKTLKTPTDLLTQRQFDFF